MYFWKLKANINFFWLHYAKLNGIVITCSAFVGRYVRVKKSFGIKAVIPVIQILPNTRHIYVQRRWLLPTSNGAFWKDRIQSMFVTPLP